MKSFRAAVRVGVLGVKITTEALSAVIIAIGVIAVFGFAVQSRGIKGDRRFREARLRFSRYLSLALELLLASDILATAMEPSWADVGMLAAIAAIRTGLNYFLEREMRDLTTDV